MNARLTCVLPLPATFRPADILAFHRRDSQEVAERAGPAMLEKGIVWDDRPACLTVRFEGGTASAELAVDGGVAAEGQARFEAMVRRTLALTQDVEGFEERYRDHPQVGRLIARQPGLRVPVITTPFEALSWAITGQQISVTAAISLRRKLILAAGMRHLSGLMCYPEARHLAALSEETLRQAGFSGSKAKTLLTLAQLVSSGDLPFERWTPAVPVDEIRGQLLAVRGIGPWTANYALLRGFGWLDGSLHGDVAVRSGLQILLGVPERIGEVEAQQWLAQFSPWRALVAAHLWTVKSPLPH